ncbi:MAG: type IV toxin-antitoxin system AbiEi family antitoxin domain-containing protein [Planctomycetes bacterium]|nr:type IV toxin-antitoxin system AbiEi family antitoxin domain-containing protein [Planctomycetota bacterium]
MAKSIRDPDGRDALQRAARVFRRHGGTLRTMQAVRLGVHPRTLYAMRENGILDQLARGLYRLADLPPLGTPDLVAVAKLVPAGVVCLISALSFHELTTQIPHAVHVAIPRGAETPRVDHPPLRVFRFGGESFGAGIDEHEIDGVKIRIYGPAKTIADCFKFRNVVGSDTALEGLKLYLNSKHASVDELMRCARMCRVAAVMRPYVEALL